jgi:nucleotide-binding universal stress UspA family protein
MVAVDGEHGHRAALQWAADRAVRDGARLEVVFVIERTWGDDPEGPPDVLSRAAEAIVADALGRIRVPDEVSVRYPYGHVGAELAAASRDADLLVLGTHSGVEPVRGFRGSLAVRVAASAECSVVVVPHDWEESGTGVVVGVDGKPPAEEAVAFAAAEAAALGERLHIVCVGYAANPLLAGLVPEVSLGDHRDRIVDAAAELARGLHEHLDVDTEVLEASPSHGLVEAADGSRMLVVGTHDRHGVQRLMLGSVAHDVLLNVRVPVAVARRRRDR